jgi:KamA family protein
MKFSNKFKNFICSVKDLSKYLGPINEESSLKKIIKIHPMRIPKYYMDLIKKSKNSCLKKMFVPSVEELDLSGEYDPSEEKQNTKSIGLQHKYSQTVLLLVTNTCFGYCRFCFRKRLVGLSQEEILKQFKEAIKYIKNHKEIDNVLISGGDPLTLPTNILQTLLEKLSAISHLNFIRIGTRAPATFPERILKDKKLLEFLKKCTQKKRIYFVTHFNHPEEITKESKAAIQKLQDANLIVSNQTVLLKGVNNNPDTLSTLMNELTKIGVLPYYIFQCRPVKSVKSQFQIPLYEGYKIIEETNKKLNGHSKRFRYVMSHKTGKIEIVGMDKNYFYFKYHQAKDAKNLGRFFKKKINKKASWLD